MKDEKRKGALSKSFLLIIFLWLFALTSPLPFPLKTFSIISLIGAAFFIGNLHLTFPEVTFHRNLWQWRPNLGWYVVVTIIISLLLSSIARQSSDLSFLPVQIGRFMFVAVFIGIMEELVFRGFVQGSAATQNQRLAVLIAALGHAGYKVLLFVNQQASIDISFGSLFGATFLAGIIAGLSRYWSGSLWPAVLAHAIFDFWLYGDLDVAPWWVW